jgi:hypothetical protein
MTFKIFKLEAWGDRVPTLTPPETHPHEYENFRAAYNELQAIAEEYQPEEIERFSNNVLQIRCKLSEEQARKEFNRPHVYLTVVFFITQNDQ